MATGEHTGHYLPDDPDQLPEEELSKDEAPTPTWLPLLGLCFALLTLFAWLVTRPAGKTMEELRDTGASIQRSRDASPSPNTPRTPLAASAKPRPAE